MRCVKCAKISLKLICKDCQKILSEYQQGCRLVDGFKVYYFYKYSDIKEILSTKHHLCEYMKGYHHEDDEKYERVFEMIEKVLGGENMPATWMPYMGKPGGHMSIIEMELGEMDKAYKGMKATTPTVTHSDFIHEMVHAAAAIVYAIEAMTCDK